MTLTTWIFQSNPKKFDIEKELDNNSEILWSVTYAKHRSLIRYGDIVFIWKSDYKEVIGGIVAKAKIISEDIKKQSDDKFYVTLEIVEYKKQNYLKRKIIEKNELLKNLHIIKVRTGNNFLLNNEEAKEINKLWNINKQQDKESTNGEIINGVKGTVENLRREDIILKKRTIYFETFQYDSWKIDLSNKWKVKIYQGYDNSFYYVVFKNGKWGSYSKVPLKYLNYVKETFNHFEDVNITNKLDQFCTNYPFWTPHPTSYNVVFYKDEEPIHTWGNVCGLYWEFVKDGILPEIVGTMMMLKNAAK